MRRHRGDARALDTLLWGAGLLVLFAIAVTAAAVARVAGWILGLGLGRREGEDHVHDPD